MARRPETALVFNYTEHFRATRRRTYRRCDCSPAAGLRHRLVFNEGQYALMMRCLAQHTGHLGIIR